MYTSSFELQLPLFTIRIFSSNFHISHAADAYRRPKRVEYTTEIYIMFVLIVSFEISSITHGKEPQRHTIHAVECIDSASTNNGLHHLHTCNMRAHTHICAYV